MNKVTKYIIIGGVIWLIYKWLNSIERYMRLNNIRYGDIVINTIKDPWGKEKSKTGTVIKFNGIPFVKFLGPINVITMEPLTKEYKKN